MTNRGLLISFSQWKTEWPYRDDLEIAALIEDMICGLRRREFKKHKLYFSFFVNHNVQSEMKIDNIFMIIMAVNNVVLDGNPEVKKLQSENSFCVSFFCPYSR